MNKSNSEEMAQQNINPSVKNPVKEGWLQKQSMCIAYKVKQDKQQKMDKLTFSKADI